MLGVLCPGRGRLRGERIDLHGLAVFWVWVPMGGCWQRRRLARAEQMLLRQGVRRLLPMADQPEWGSKIPAEDPLPLYRAVADRLVLEELRRRGVPSRCGMVALAGEQVDGELARTARLLCPEVRVLVLEVEHGGHRLARELYREFGVAVRMGGPADLCVRFSGLPRAGELALCPGGDPVGVEVDVPGLWIPEQLDRPAVLAALLQAGRIDVKDLCLRDKREF